LTRCLGPMLNLLMVAVLEVQFCLFVLVAIAMARIALVDEAAEVLYVSHVMVDTIVHRADNTLVAGGVCVCGTHVMAKRISSIRFKFRDLLNDGSSACSALVIAGIVAVVVVVDVPLDALLVYGEYGDILAGLYVSSDHGGQHVVLELFRENILLDRSCLLDGVDANNEDGTNSCNGNGIETPAGYHLGKDAKVVGDQSGRTVRGNVRAVEVDRRGGSLLQRGDVALELSIT